MNIQGSFNRDVVDIGKSYLTKWDADKNDVVSVFGEVPKLYDEMMAEISEDNS